MRATSLGWKSYYECAPSIYLDPRLLIPIPRRFVRDHNILGMDVKEQRMTLNEVAKYVVLKLIFNALAKKKLAREHRRGVTKA